MRADQTLWGGIEAGGTKFVLALGSLSGEIVARHSLPTGHPDETLAKVADWFEGHGGVSALGIASFGPVDLNPHSPLWGHITKTPKPGWSQCDLVGFFARRWAIPIGFDTDVNAAALAEAAAVGDASATLAYVTIGTGIGGGLVIAGQAVHGAAHPEMGHIYPRRPDVDRSFAGVCPYHGDCLEGLASGPAIVARWRASLSDLPPDHVGHQVIADYLAQLCHALFAMSAVETVVLGGGVMNTPGLLARVQARAAALDGQYLPGRARHCIRAPLLGNDAGVCGALILGQRAAALGH